MFRQDSDTKSRAGPPPASLTQVVGGNDGSLAYFRNTGSSTKAEFQPVEQANGPFTDVVVDASSKPLFTDLDRDGDLDLVVGNQRSGVVFYRNTGSISNPEFIIAARNPFATVAVGSFATPAIAMVDGFLSMVIGSAPGRLVVFSDKRAMVFNKSPVADAKFGTFGGNYDGSGMGANAAAVDLNGDGLQDLVVGNQYGMGLYRNTGLPTAPHFNASGINPFADINIFYGKPAFADLDSDGDQDLVVGNGNGWLHYFRNEGDATTPIFIELDSQESPVADIDVGSLGFAGPAFADLDDDGDQDLIVVKPADGSKSIHYYRNDGNSTSPNFVEAAVDPFAGVDMSSVDFDTDPVATFTDFDSAHRS